METLRRSLEWARGRMIDDITLEDILEKVDDYIQEVRAMQHEAQQGIKCKMMTNERSYRTIAHNYSVITYQIYSLYYI